MFPEELCTGSGLAAVVVADVVVMTVGERVETLLTLCSAVVDAAVPDVVVVVLVPVVVEDAGA